MDNIVNEAKENIKTVKDNVIAMSIAPTHPPSNAKIGLLGYFWTSFKNDL